MVRVLFVCMGNICRSPMAEAVFRHRVDEAGLSDRIETDSAGTGGWHAGERPHPGTQAILARQGIACDGCARQITRRDFDRFDYIVAMDGANLRELARHGPGRATVTRLLDYAPDAGAEDVPDPYYDGRFDEVYRLVRQGVDGLLSHLRREHGLS